MTYHVQSHNSGYSAVKLFLFLYILYYVIEGSLNEGKRQHLSHFK